MLTDNLSSKLSEGYPGFLISNLHLINGIRCIYISVVGICTS